jgi:hypothetical protein
VALTIRQELVWWGSVDGVAEPAIGLHVCDYNGSIGNHLCYFTGKQVGEYAHGYGAILDQSYRIVKTVHSTRGTDMHQFDTIEDGSKALLTEYAVVPMDLTSFGVNQSIGWVEDSIFKEVHLDTQNVLLEWHSIDHVVPDPETTSAKVVGKGRTRHSPLDYFHINSIDKNNEGDYLVSARHLNTIYKVSGIDGHIIWQMSNRPDSAFDLGDIILFGQHDVRWISVRCPIGL